jgi:hypothetical protein
MSWQHIRPADLPWRVVASGHSMRTLTQDPFVVQQHRIDARTDALLKGLVLVQEGSGELAGGVLIIGGDLLWQQTPHPVHASGAGLVWSELELPVPMQPGVESFKVGVDEKPWVAFEDPAGRPTQPVQILLEGSLSALRTRFVPSYEAGEHWHDFDTLYFITAGDMQFGFEGQYHTGDVRQVRGGYAYGPEKPGPSGVEFVLFSCGGPVNLHWSDLEPSPHGALRR